MTKNSSSVACRDKLTHSLVFVRVQARFESTSVLLQLMMEASELLLFRHVFGPAATARPPALVVEMYVSLPFLGILVYFWL